MASLLSLARRLAARLPGLAGGRFRVEPTPLGWVTSWGVVDWADVDASGLIRIFGWSHERSDRLTPPSVSLNGAEVRLNKLYRMLRSDVPKGPAHLAELPGVVFEYLLADDQYEQVGPELCFAMAGQPPKLVRAPARFVRPHFHHMFAIDEVLGRDRIYGFGPPSLQVHPEVLELAKATQGTVLDFGCGAGALVAALRREGREAHGIELDRPPIRESLLPPAATYVRLYDGGFPSPFADKSFDTVICSEVLEHIPDYQGAIAEIARVCRRSVLLTVPDMAAIPLGARHGLVPWHLLESTHVNFFTQESLGECLQPYFPRVTFGRITKSYMQDTLYFVNLVAVCELPD